MRPISGTGDASTADNFVDPTTDRVPLEEHQGGPLPHSVCETRHADAHTQPNGRHPPTTGVSQTAEPDPSRKVRDWSAGFSAVVAITFLYVAGLMALANVAPLWVVHGGAGKIGAGAVSGVLGLTTVAAQRLTPALLRRWSAATVLASGLLGFGLAAVLTGASDRLVPVLVLSACRGLGLGMLTVTCSAAVITLAPERRRGAAMGVYGLAVTLPTVVLLPTSVTLAHTLSYWWSFGLGAVPIVALPLVRWMPTRLNTPAAFPTDAPHGRPLRGAGVRAGLPTYANLVVSAACGALMTFLPQLTAHAWTWSSLLIITGCSALARWKIGALIDAHSADRMLRPLLTLTALGVIGSAAAVAGVGNELLVVSVGLCGIGYGALQTVTLVQSFARTDVSHYAAASATWNIASSLGVGVGGFMLGALADAWGFPIGILACAGLIIVCLGAGIRSTRPARAVDHE